MAGCGRFGLRKFNILTTRIPGQRFILEDRTRSRAFVLFIQLNSIDSGALQLLLDTKKPSCQCAAQTDAVSIESSLKSVFISVSNLNLDRCIHGEPAFCREGSSWRAFTHRTCWSVDTDDSLEKTSKLHKK